jgi:hypothetical protein
VRKGRCEAELCDSQNEITSWLRAFSSMDQWKKRKHARSLAFNEQIVWHSFIHLYQQMWEKKWRTIENIFISCFLINLKTDHHV